MKNNKGLKITSIVLGSLLVISLLISLALHIINNNLKEEIQSQNAAFPELKIEKIGLDKYFLPNVKNNLYCVDYNVCAYNWIGNTPDKANSRLLIGAHNGANSNAYFKDIDKLHVGDIATIVYNDEYYSYKMVRSYKSPKSKHSIKVPNKPGKYLYLLTEARDNNYSEYFFAVEFKAIDDKSSSADEIIIEQE